MKKPGKPVIASYGSWRSPVTPKLITSDSLRLSDPRDGASAIYWLEGRPAEAGRTVLVRSQNDGSILDVTPAPYNVRSKAHEYGGGAYALAGERVWFVNFDDQCLYVVDGNTPPRRLTEPSTRRFADLEPDLARNRLIAVCEDHVGDSEPVTTLVAIGLDDGDVTTLARGHDFFSTPRLSPCGGKLAWLHWDHPDMPWDSTVLNVAGLDDAGQPCKPQQVAGGDGVSVFQPEWTGSGELVFASDETGWWNLVRFDGRKARPLAPAEAEYAQPQWVFGMRTHAPIDAGFVLAASTRDGTWRLETVGPDGTVVAVDTPYTTIDSVHAGSRGCVLLAGAPDRPMTVLEIDPLSGKTRSLRSASAVTVDAAVLSQPQPIAYPTTGGDTAHALFYPPTNAGFAAPGDELPPLLVTCHGGPTAATDTSLNLRTQFWTSRGIGVLDVNYRGSTGYGRAYRDKLRGQWGVADVDDAVHGALYLVERGLADKDRLLIRGGSAGGYTVLSALTFRDTFRAGASYYGIGDLEALMADTHKFESRYGDRLIGPLPAAADTYRARSPVHHAKNLSSPVIFFQGLDDKVVPPNQTRRMADVLRHKGIPVAVLEFAGEGHGFRRAETIIATLEAELYFYARVLGFEPADALPGIPIDNLD